MDMFVTLIKFLRNSKWIYIKPRENILEALTQDLESIKSVSWKFNLWSSMISKSKQHKYATRVVNDLNKGDYFLYLPSKFFSFIIEIINLNLASIDPSWIHAEIYFEVSKISKAIKNITKNFFWKVYKILASRIFLVSWYTYITK